MKGGELLWLFDVNTCPTSKYTSLSTSSYNIANILGTKEGSNFKENFSAKLVG